MEDLAKVASCAFDVCLVQTAEQLSFSEHNRRLTRPPGTSEQNREIAPLGPAHAERSREWATKLTSKNFHKDREPWPPKPSLVKNWE